ncbi:MAG: SprT family zinc-dependent metalloprotease [Bacillota bacterium]|nr:SprT family zinc-dependent metalloprotease [Bacillota bacterium]
MQNTKEYNIIIAGLSIPYGITESSKAKNIRLVIDQNGLRIVKPKRVGTGEVDRVIKEKAEWVYKHFNEFQERRAKIPVRKWESGESVLYLGEKYIISIKEHNKNTVSVGFNGVLFEMLIDSKIYGEERRVIIESAFKKWYKKAAYKIFDERLKYFCGITGMKYDSMRIKEQKTRWGSCSGKGNLNFNWKLIMAPLWVIDYVILHEVCHLKHLNHSKDFWKMTRGYMPDYKNAQEWLKKNGITLAL